MVAVWLVIVNVFALLAFNRLNLAPDSAMKWMTPGSIRSAPQSWDVVEVHNRWDAYWYLDIAKNGYYQRGHKQLSNVVYFPMYPLLMRYVGLALGGNFVLAGWIISMSFLVLSITLFIRLIREFHPQLDPMLPGVFLLAHPAAFFLNAVYTESMFLALSLAVALYARRGRFWVAGGIAALASATRVSGLFLAVLLLVEFLGSFGWRALLSRRAVALAIAPLGTLAFFTYHFIAFDDFFLFLRAQETYGRDFDIQLTDFTIRNAQNLVASLFDWFFYGCGVLLGIVALFRVRTSYGIYMLVTLGIAFSSGSILGAVRYMLVLFPIYIVAAGIRSDLARGAWLLGSILLLALHIISFANHYWAG